MNPPASTFACNTYSYVRSHHVHRLLEMGFGGEERTAARRQSAARKPSMAPVELFDVIVVGGGGAGLAAAI